VSKGTQHRKQQQHPEQEIVDTSIFVPAFIVASTHRDRRKWFTLKTLREKIREEFGFLYTEGELQRALDTAVQEGTVSSSQRRTRGNTVVTAYSATPQSYGFIRTLCENVSENPTKAQEKLWDMWQ
jgi:hypothetical protein